MRSDRVRIITEVALTIALCATLKVFAIRVPVNVVGGTISLEMLPLMVLSLRRGPMVGMAAGALFGVVDVVFEPYAIHPIQFVLDYPLAYGAVGLTGLGARSFLERVSEGAPVAAAFAAVPWMLLGAAARFAAHLVSGVVFFSANAPAGQPVWLYSAAYNATYMIPSTVACVVAALLVLPVLSTAVPVAPKPGTP